MRYLLGKGGGPGVSHPGDGKNGGGPNSWCRGPPTTHTHSAAVILEGEKGKRRMKARGGERRKEEDGGGKREIRRGVTLNCYPFRIVTFTSTCLEIFVNDQLL